MSIKFVIYCKKAVEPYIINFIRTYTNICIRRRQRIKQRKVIHFKNEKSRNMMQYEKMSVLENI